jgi:hypothetical protein
LVDYAARGSFIKSTALENIQPKVNSVFRSALHPPSDITLDVLMTPLEAYGWGLPDLIVRSQLAFIQGYCEAFDCRDTLARTVMREQVHQPFSVAQNDHQVMESLCFKYGLTFRPFEELCSHSFPPLTPLIPQLSRSAYLFVTTDAGQDLPAEPLEGLVAGKAGLGIDIRNGEGINQQWSFGFTTLGASSTDLEWFAKLIALFLCKSTSAKLYCTIDSSSAQVCKFQQFLRITPWLDRFAKVVFGELESTNFVELWTPAQHDTGYVGSIADWQAAAHNLATFGKQHAELRTLPLTVILASIHQSPATVWFKDALVFNLKNTCRLIYVDTVYQRSPLKRVLSGVSFDTFSWRAVVDDPLIPLEHHQVALHLRVSPMLSRLFFPPPACRYCDLADGDISYHLERCPALYIRICMLLDRTVDLVRPLLHAVVDSQGDNWSVLSNKGGRVMVLVGSEVYIKQVLTEYRLGFKMYEVVAMSWSGLVYQTAVSQKSPQHRSKVDRVRLSKMAIDVVHQRWPLDTSFLERKKCKSSPGDASPPSSKICSALVKVACSYTNLCSPFPPSHNACQVAHSI